MPEIETSDPSPGLDSAMDSFFSAPAESPTSDDSPAPDAAAEQVAEPTPPEAEQVADGTTGEQDPDAAAEQPDDSDDMAPVDTTGKKAIQIDAGRFDRIYGRAKMADEIREFAPTVEAAKAQYETANDYRAMHADFQSADPASVDAWIDHWANESKDGFALMATRLPEKLQATNPEAYEALSTQILTQKVEQLYQEAAESGDPHLKYQAQLLDYKLTGKYRTELTKPDPLAQRQAELDRRQAALEKAEGDRQTKVWTNFSARVDQAKSNGLNAAIDKVLAPVAKSFEKAPELLDAVKAKIAAQVEQTLKNDFEWNRNHDIDLRTMRRNFDNAWKTGAKTNVNSEAQAIVEGYLARAQRIIAGAAKPLINQATSTLVAQNKAKHDQLSRGQNRRGPSGGGAPSARPAVQLPADASLDDKMDAFFAS